MKRFHVHVSVPDLTAIPVVGGADVTPVETAPSGCGCAPRAIAGAKSCCS